MPRDEQPIDPALRSILDQAGLESLASVLRSVPDEPEPKPEPQPVWPNKPLIRSIHELNDFKIRSRRVRYRYEYHFKTTIGYTHLAAPLELMPPDVLPDPLLVNWAWVDPSYPLGSREAVMRLAHKLVDNPPKSGTIPGISDDQATLLKVAGTLAKSDPIIPVAVLAKKIKKSLHDTLDSIYELKTYGEWPYSTDIPVGDPDDPAEMATADEIIARLRTLHPDSARRILNMVIAGKPWVEGHKPQVRSTDGLIPYKRRVVNVAMSTAEPRSDIQIYKVAKKLGRDQHFLNVLISSMRVNGEWPNGLLDIGDPPSEEDKAKTNKTRKKRTKK